MIEVANYIALKYGLVFGENGESVLDVSENILQAHLYCEADPGFSFFFKPDKFGLSVFGSKVFSVAEYCDQQRDAHRSRTDTD